jgi:hypothetical protein
MDLRDPQLAVTHVDAANPAGCVANNRIVIDVDGSCYPNLAVSRGERTASKSPSVSAMDVDTHPYAAGSRVEPQQSAISGDAHPNTPVLRDET